MPWSTCNRRCVAFLAMICLASQAISADHVDGPRATNAGALAALDLNDLYVFVSPVNRNNTVLVLTTGGRVGLVNPVTFMPGALYQIRVSNDGDPTNDDEVVFEIVFSNADKFGRQNYTLRQIRRNRGNDPSVLARGVTGQQIAGSLGIKVQAGVFDDPFFFDSTAFGAFRTNTQNGVPLPDRAAPFLSGPFANGFPDNTLAIVIELPRKELQSSPSNPNITVWLRALRPDGTQFDRTGLPAINTATLFPIARLNLPGLQDTFNSLMPKDDVGLRAIAAERINVIYGLPLNGPVPNTPPGTPNATQLAAVVLPDVMPFNTTSTGGFLNGRRLTDDVIDAELNLLTGGVLKSDRISNDSKFLNKFPYLGPAKKK